MATLNLDWRCISSALKKTIHPAKPKKSYYNSFLVCCYNSLNEAFWLCYPIDYTELHWPMAEQFWNFRKVCKLHYTLWKLGKRNHIPRPSDAYMHFISTKWNETNTYKYRLVVQKQWKWCKIIWLGDYKMTSLSIISFVESYSTAILYRSISAKYYYILQPNTGVQLK